jgi:hypothetical protein
MNNHPRLVCQICGEPAVYFKQDLIEIPSTTGCQESKALPNTRYASCFEHRIPSRFLKLDGTIEYDDLLTREQFDEEIANVLTEEVPDVLAARTDRRLGRSEA